MTANIASRSGLLSGLSVIDCSTGTMGPYCGRLFAELGAQVLKVELPEGDPARRMGPFLGQVPGTERSGLFAYLNAGKQGLSIDYLSLAGREQLLSLIHPTDVLIESFGPGGLAAAGIDAVRLMALNPQLVIASLSPYGLTGPYKDRPSSELTLLASAGWLNQVGEPGRAPLKSSGRMSGATAPALFAAYAILAALRERDESGLGQQIDVSAMESILAASRYFETTYEYFGVEVQRAGSIQIYECLDGYVSVSPGVSGKWDMFFALIGRPELLEEHQRGAIGSAEERARSYDQLVREWVKDKTRTEVFHSAQEFGIVAAPVSSIDEVAALPPLIERDAFATVEHPVLGRFLAPGPAFRIGGMPRELALAPLLGQHTADIPGALDRGSPAVPATSPNGRTAPSPSPSKPRSLPLAGIRVLEATTFMAGPFAAALLADLGAEVIKVEAIQRLDGWRSFFVDNTNEQPWETGACYNTVNRNKLGLTLDLGCAEGVELFRKLVAASDVMVENFSQRMWLNLGLTYRALAEINPGLVLASVNGFGAETSWNNYVSIGSTAEALSGLASVTGYPGEGPLKHGTWLSDPLASLNAVVGVLAALRAKARTGKGALIDVSQIDATIPTIADAFMDWSLNGRVWGRSGNADRERAPSGTYRCAGEDRWLALCIESDEQWRALAALLGRPDWSTLSLSGRQTIAEQIDSAINTWSSNKDRDAAVETLLSQKIDAASVLTPPEILKDPHLEARGFFEYVERRLVGVHPYVGVVPKFSATPGHIRTPAPTLGEHNDYVLASVLGLSPAEIEGLTARRVIGDTPLFAMPVAG